MASSCSAFALRAVHQFVRESSVEPILAIPRPLPATSTLETLGLPEWSMDLLNSIPFNGALLDVMEAAEHFNAEMLSQLIAARISFNIRESHGSSIFSLSDQPLMTQKDRSKRLKAIVRHNAVWASVPLSDVTADTCRRCSPSDILRLEDLLATTEDVAVAAPDLSVMAWEVIATDPRIRNAGDNCLHDGLPKYYVRSVFARMIALFME